MTTTTERYFRFEDDKLQVALIRDIENTDIPYRRLDDGGVVFDEAIVGELMSRVNRIRDTQFPWYLHKWSTESESARYREMLTEAGLLFVLERHEDGTWFVLRREDRTKHDELWQRVQDNEDGSAGS